MKLHEIAPRLAQARDQRRAELREHDLSDRRYHERHHQLERVIAHRELQLQRAQSTRRNDQGRYIAERQRKLKDSVDALARLEKRHASELRARL